MNRSTSFLFLREMRRLCRRNYQTNSASGKILNKTRSLFIVSAGSVLAYLGEFGFRFSTPVGLAAGFDKDGEAVAGIHNMGFSFVEVGSVTPLPQEGNPKPRVFRLPEDGAVINRYGFNSAGHDVVFQRLSDFRHNSPPPLPPPSTSFTRNSLPEMVVRDNSRESTSVHGPISQDHFSPQPILGVNLGKNKTSPSPIGDYVSGVEKFAPVADYLVINVSSPNTPGLRDMQGKATLEALLDAALETLNSTPVGRKKPPLLVKIAPDLTEEDVDDVVDVLLQRSGPNGVAGVIVSNTTISRPSTLQNDEIARETGGLSGRPLRDLSTRMIERVYKSSGGKIPIIGCGGISSGADAYEKILAGASLVQIYSALVFGGPPIVKAITRELNELLVKDGFESVEQAVGAGTIERVDLKDLRRVMEDMVLEKFAKEEMTAKMAMESASALTEGESRNAENRTSSEPAVTPTHTPTETPTEALTETLSETRTETQTECKDALLANYYSIPQSHMKRKTSRGVTSAS